MNRQLNSLGDEKKNRIFFVGHLDYCETFKLQFDDEKKLINIENIKLN